MKEVWEHNRWWNYKIQNTCMEKNLNGSEMKKKTLLLYTDPTNPRFKFSRRSINKFQVGGAVESWRTKKIVASFEYGACLACHYYHISKFWNLVQKAWENLKTKCVRAAALRQVLRSFCWPYSDLKFYPRPSNMWIVSSSKPVKCDNIQVRVTSPITWKFYFSLSEVHPPEKHATRDHIVSDDVGRRRLPFYQRESRYGHVFFFRLEDGQSTVYSFARVFLVDPSQCLEVPISSLCSPNK